MTCPHCRAETPAESARCVVCSGALPPNGAAENLASPGGPFPDGPTISSGPASPWAASAASGVLGPGQLFASRYRIERVLGTGGMGAVYRAIDVELDAPVALKVIRSENLADPQTGRDFEQRFKQELLLARKVTHQNVLRIHDLGDWSGIKYITMPIVDGSDLHALLASGPMPFERVLSLAQQIVAGLAAAHDAGIMHRDLKPQNILVDESGRAYISDFGLAKSYEATALGLTRRGDFIGTPRYIAPEIVEGQPADHRSDLYAIGLILYEMASGELPFKGNTVMEILMQRVRKTPKDLREVNPDVPEFFSRIVMRCLAKDPADRYQRASEILADLDAARPPSKGRTSQSISINLPLPTQRGWVVAAMLVAVIAGLVALPPVRALFFGGTTAAEGIPPASQQKLVAVLPFRTIGSADELEHIGAGVAEGLRAKLFGMSALTVASGSAAERVDASLPKPRIARELGSNLLVTGTVQGGGGRIAITVNLEEPLADRHVWTQQFSGDPRDLLTLQDHIFNSLVDALEVSPSTAERTRSISRPTENVAAYDLYLKGRNAMRGQQDRRNVEAAVKFFKEAVEADPRFALAFAGLSDASVQMYRETKDRLWADQAVFASQQAKQLDENLLEVRLALGNAYSATGKTNEAIAELTSALELAPNSDDGYRRLASAYRRAGKVAEAVRMSQKAVDLNPYYWLNHNALGANYLYLGDYEKAADAFQRVIQLEPDNVNGHNDLGAAYILIGRYKDAAEAFQRSLALVPTADSHTNLGIALAWQGRFQEALPEFQQAVDVSPNVDGWLSNLGDGYRWLGQDEKAKETYDRAIGLAYKSLQVNPSDAVTRSRLGTYHAKKGETAEGLKLVLEAEAADPSHLSILHDVAKVRLLAGQNTEALAALRKALNAGYPARFAGDDPDWKPLARDPRFQALVKESRPATAQ